VNDIDTEGMKQDLIEHAKVQFTHQNYLIHGSGPDGSVREPPEQRERRWDAFVDKLSTLQMYEQTKRFFASIEKFRPGAIRMGRLALLVSQKPKSLEPYLR
jgi:hypothetical protein